ncbi:uncharacterized protein LOC143296295 [Babylonia areolata]|uniref:uncharacterized protein LOC143296295 n=1 Tax=Babylonia areolata TaxID=304850 RepID=UPI003FD3BE99
MAPQMTFKVAQKFLQCSHLCENISAVPRSLGKIYTLSSRPPQADLWHTDKKCFSSLQYGNPIESAVSKNDIGNHRSRACDGRLYRCQESAKAETVFNQMMSSQRLWVSTRNCCQGFSTSVCAASKFGVGGFDHGKPVEPQASRPDRGKDWALRLANENGYLSWCRNTYLTTVVSLAMMEEGNTTLTEQAAKGALVVAALNLSWGTYHYIYNTVRLRRQTGMSSVGVGAHSSLALLHLMLWFMVCAAFLGNTEEEPDGGQGGEMDMETERQSVEQ